MCTNNHTVSILELCMPATTVATWFPLSMRVGIINESCSNSLGCPGSSQNIAPSAECYHHRITYLSIIYSLNVYLCHADSSRKLRNEINKNVLFKFLYRFPIN